MEVVGAPSRLHRSVNFQLTDGRNVRATSDSTIMYLLKYMSPGEKKTVENLNEQPRRGATGHACQTWVF